MKKTFAVLFVLTAGLTHNVIGMLSRTQIEVPEEQKTIQQQFEQQPLSNKNIPQTKDADYSLIQKMASDEQEKLSKRVASLELYLRTHRDEFHGPSRRAFEQELSKLKRLLSQTSLS